MNDKIEKHLADSRTTAIHYVVAVMVTTLAAVLQGALSPAPGQGYSFILFYPAVMVAAWFGGL